jgi:hypothetical protein
MPDTGCWRFLTTAISHLTFYISQPARMEEPGRGDFLAREKQCGVYFK